MTNIELRTELIKILEVKVEIYRKYWHIEKRNENYEIASECLGKMLAFKEAITLITDYTEK